MTRSVMCAPLAVTVMYCSGCSSSCPLTMATSAADSFMAGCCSGPEKVAPHRSIVVHGPARSMHSASSWSRPEVS